jgi:predicted nucleic acid-binding protein
MAVVLDVSVAVAWFFSDEHAAVAGQLLDAVARDGAYVPALFRWEIQSALFSAERAARIAPDDVDAALAALRDLPIVVESAGERVFAGSELRLARHFDLTPYDAAYLALAADRRVPLATFDAALTRAARELGLDVRPDL